MRKAKFSKALSLALEPAMFDHIKMISDEGGTSMSEVIRVVLRDVFGFKLPEYTMDEMFREKGYQKHVNNDQSNKKS